MGRKFEQKRKAKWEKIKQIWSSPSPWLSIFHRSADLEVTFQDLLIQLNQDLPINLLPLKSLLVLRKLHGTQ